MLTDVIHTVTVELECSDEESALAAQRSFLSDFSPILQPLIDEEIAASGWADRVLAIDKLEIDLGNIASGELGSAGLFERFRFVFRDQLRKAAARARPGGPRAWGDVPGGGWGKTGSYQAYISGGRGEGARAGGPSWSSADKAELAMLQEFLLTGQLPWWADITSAPDVGRLFDTVLDRDPAALLNFLRRHRFSVAVVQRLCGLAEPETLRRVTKRMANIPGSEERLVPLATENPVVWETRRAADPERLPEGMGSIQKDRERSQEDGKSIQEDVERLLRRMFEASPFGVKWKTMHPDQGGRSFQNKKLSWWNKIIAGGSAWFSLVPARPGWSFGPGRSSGPDGERSLQWVQNEPAHRQLLRILALLASFDPGMGGVAWDAGFPAEAGAGMGSVDAARTGRERGEGFGALSEGLVAPGGLVAPPGGLVVAPGGSVARAHVSGPPADRSVVSGRESGDLPGRADGPTGRGVSSGDRAVSGDRAISAGVGSTGAGGASPDVGSASPGVGSTASGAGNASPGGDRAAASQKAAYSKADYGMMPADPFDAILCFLGVDRALNKLSWAQQNRLNQLIERENIQGKEDERLLRGLLSKLTAEQKDRLAFLAGLTAAEMRQLMGADRQRLSGVDRQGVSGVDRRPQSGVDRERMSGADRQPLTGAPSVGQGPPARDRLFIQNAGLCLLSAYLPTLFKRLGYVRDGAFLNAEVQARAMHLLQWLATGMVPAGEYQLAFNKLVCGWPLDMPPARIEVLKKQEKKEAEELLESVIQHWPALKKTSTAGLRSSFLQREGLLFEDAGVWTLKVERKGYDLLLGSIGWSFQLIKHPWMKKHIRVEW